MRRAKIAAALVVLSLAAAGPASASPPAAPSAAPGTTTLALAMLRALNPGTNVVFSPYSVETALAMVDQGASGQTAQQIDTLLGASSPSTLAAGNLALETGLHRAVTGYGSGGPTFDSANGLWVQSGLTLDHPFATTVSEDFGAAPQQANFSSDAAGALQTINGWISTHTHGLIPSLLGPEQVTPATELVLANAVYLNATWQTQFDPRMTESASFVAPSGAVTVPFMNSGTGGSYPYAAGSGDQAVALPYAHSSLQLLAVMPPAGKLDSFETSLTAPRLATIAARLKTRAVDLSIPKFSLSFKDSLNGFLQTHGVTQAFGPASRLDRIVRGRSLAIQAVEHAAVLKVAEKGTVAAAATGISAGPTAVRAGGILLDLNHPFLIFLRDTKTGAILFAGRVEDPSAS